MQQLGNFCSVRPIQEVDERIFTLSDIRRFYKRKKGTIFRIALLAWVATFGVFLLKAPKYKIEATFKEGIEGASESSLKDLLFTGMGASPAQPEAIVIMKSYQVLKPLISRLGLQASVPQSKGIFSKLYCRIRDNLKAQRGKPLEDPDLFVFREVLYEGEKALSYFLRFDDATHFAVLDSDRKLITQGILEGEVCLPEAQFILEKTPKNLRFRQLYKLSVVSWIPIADSLRNTLKIASQKANKSIYGLRYSHRDRFFGVALLNELMFEYQRYLKRNHDHVSKEQLAYLDQRQEEIFQKMSFTLKEHADYLSRNLGEKGVVGLEKEIESVLTPHRRMAEKMIGLDVELARLRQFEQGDHWLASADEGPFSIRLREISRSIQELKQQRDLLELSLQDREGPLLSENQLHTKQRELKEIRTRREISQKLLEAIEQQEPLEFGFDPDLSLAAWAQQLKDAKEEERGDFTDYLENHIRLLSLREKMLQERFFYGEGGSSEFEGIDLTTARTLFVEYNNRLDGYEAAMRRFAQLKEEIRRPNFEISSLSSTLPDPFSQKLVALAGELAIQLKDEKHHSEKEGQRWAEELNLQKKILSDHLEQLFKVEELNAVLTREKITNLQKISLDCIHRQISALHEQARDSIRERREALLSEKDLLEKKMAELRASMKDLPEKWQLEKWLDLKTKGGIKVMEAITQLIESKTIGHHLHHIESKPLDLAILPTIPQPPHLFQMGFLGAFLTGFGFFFLSLVRTILRGFPSSLEKLRAMRFPLLGEISSFCDGPQLDTVSGGDLEILRQVSLFLEKPPQAKVIGLIAGEGPDYSYALAQNLARRSLRPLIIRCDFRAKYQKEDLPGLLQVWKGEAAELPIRCCNGFDLLTPGGFTPYGVEIIQSKAFAELVETLKQKYDFLLLLFRSPLSQSESQAALRLCDKAIVTVSGEPTEVLTPFVDWAYHEGDCRLTFVTVPSS